MKKTQQSNKIAAFFIAIILIFYFAVTLRSMASII